MNAEQPAPAPSAQSGVLTYETVDAADAAEQMAAATTVLRAHLPLLADSQPVDPYPM